MNVEVWIRDDYARRPTASPVRHRLVFSFDDPSGFTGEILAERVWQILSGIAPHKLTDTDLAIRERFDDACAGRMLSAGDVVVCGTQRFRCRPGGWDPI